MPGSPGSLSSKIREEPGRIRDISLSLAGILLFAGFIHQDLPLKWIAIIGLIGSAAVIAYSIRKQKLLEAFALDKTGRKALLYTLPAISLGIGLALISRNRFDLSIFPPRVTGIALLAPLVGVVEELIFRGYMQGHLRPIGRVFSILYATTAHSSYKVLAILSLGLPLQFDFFFLAFWTFVGGLLFGTLRELSGHSLPSMAAHAAFDVLMYGGLAIAPVWVWA